MANKIKVGLGAINDNQDIAFLTEKRAVLPFADGKPTSDIRTHTNIGVALQGQGFAPLTIRIEGSTDPLPDVDDEKIKSLCSAMKPLIVRFKNPQISIYTINGKMQMSGTADGVEIVNTNSK